MPLPAFVNFDLLLTVDEEILHTRVITSPVGEARASSPLPHETFSPEALLQTLMRPRRGLTFTSSNGRHVPPEQTVRAVGERLFHLVFADEVATLWRRSLDAARQNGQGVRVRLRLESPALHALPWELLYDPYQHAFIAVSARTPIVRYLNIPQAAHTTHVDGAVRMLVIIAAPHGTPALDVEREWRDIHDALAPLVAQGRLVLERLTPPTPAALQAALRRGAYHVMHFIGHGDFDGAQGVLLFEDEQGAARPLDAERLTVLVGDELDALRLVVLNACRGAQTAEADMFAGVAQQLVRRGVPAVIAMQFAITDGAALTFAREFYTALVDTGQVDTALAEARKAIYAVDNNPLEWATPVLFMRDSDGRLFAPPSSKASTVSDSPSKPGDRSVEVHGSINGSIINTGDQNTITLSKKPALSFVTPGHADMAPRHLLRLRTAAKRGQLVLIVGGDAPASLTGMPSRADLARALAAQYGVPADGSLATVAQHVMQNQNRFAFTEFLINALSSVPATPAPLYAAIADLVARGHVHHVLALTYDLALQRAVQARHIAHNVVVDDTTLTFANPAHPTLYHLFGTIDRPETLLVTEQDLNAFIRRRTKPDLFSEVERLLKRHDVLLVGLDPTDPFWLALFDESAGRRFQRPAFAVWSSLAPATVQALASNRRLTVLDTDPIALLHGL
ncbi:hypothetical protein ARMA_3022 [Ardenticatena maritima]|uniref:CHAT domain-containing protein n=1 Tax=Ardenticatena maritima TaxID=872965 RepID=A0A0M8KBW1_9CHLR|nr:CHAT domain-containing protein [Ardenticatena maritima]KPL87193.1 hypothetical protein SE16_11760 [Ardenticatena maritima]GAP64599.1 hypothetical protein ARMA_3022 [Ardenticatena maritima]